MGTHYSTHQDKKALLSRAQSLSTKLAKKLEEHDGPVYLVYSGMSGISLATAIMLGSSFPFEMAYVRKPEEESHGLQVEYSDRPARGAQDIVGVFVDDFISSGATLRRCRKAVPFPILYAATSSERKVETLKENSYDA